MCKERRKAENMALRELIDALKKVINARDALWSLGLFDRIFRFGKCRAIFSEYDDAMQAVRNAVSGVIKTTAHSEGAAAGKDAGKTAGAVSGGPENQQNSSPIISMEEFEVLLGKPKYPRDP